MRDGVPTVRALVNRHYSRRHYRDGRTTSLFVGPGEKIVLRWPAGDACFVWRRFWPIGADRNGPHPGVNCAVFRNETEGRLLSSALILDAERYARERWPGERFYTYVNGRKIISPNPGYCFIKEGWQRRLQDEGRARHSWRRSQHEIPKETRGGRGVLNPCRDGIIPGWFMGAVKRGDARPYPSDTSGIMRGDRPCIIRTLHGYVNAMPGDWIAMGVNGRHLSD